jgi:hypothetical protein
LSPTSEIATTPLEVRSAYMRRAIGAGEEVKLMARRLS